MRRFAPIVRARPCPTFADRSSSGSPSITARTSPHTFGSTSRWNPVSGVTQRAASGSPWLYQAFASCPLGFSIPSPFSGHELTPAFGYSAPHLSAGGTSTSRTMRAQRTLWPLLTSGDPSQRLATGSPKANRRPPRVLRTHFTLMLSIYVTGSVQVLGLHLLACSPAVPLYPLAVRQATLCLQLPPDPASRRTPLPFSYTSLAGCVGTSPKVSGPAGRTK